MSNKVKMPNLTIDEVILLVEAYFRLKDTKEAAERQDIISELSFTMKNMPFFPKYKDYPEFRSEVGMKLCLKNVEFLEPDGKSKLGHGSELQRKVLEYYSDNIDVLRKLSISIREVSKATFPLNNKYKDSIFGVMVPSFHEYLEQSNSIINAIKKHSLENDKTTCKLCGMDLSQIYKEAAMLMELHINIPIYENVPGCSVTPSKVICVCPTCHKLLHSKLNYYDSSRAKEQIR